MRDDQIKRKRAPYDAAEKARRERIEDLRDEYEIVDRIEEEYTSRQRRRRRHIAGIIGVIALLLTGVLLMLILQTYDAVQVLDSHALSDAGSNGYTAFAGGILKYNRDGVSLMDAEGEDKWNQATQLQQPVIATSQQYAASADVTGTAVYIFDEKGLVKQLQTGKPIERVFVGNDGTAALIQENGSTPVVSCYDRKGALLLKHQASLSESGYPISAALSDDGKVLVLSYLKASGKGVSGKIAFFDIKEHKQDNTIYTEDLDGEAAGEVFFMDNMAVAVCETQCLIYEGADSPKKKKTIELEGEIEKVFHDQRYFGFVLRLPNGERSLTVYSRTGAKKLDKTITGVYERAVLSDNQVILFGGQECCIYTLRGIHRFDGQMLDGMLYVMPVRGLNRYAVVTNEGIEKVYLTR